MLCHRFHTWLPLVSYLLLNCHLSDGFGYIAPVRVRTTTVNVLPVATVSCQTTTKTIKSRLSKWFSLFMSDSQSDNRSTISAWLVENLETRDPTSTSTSAGGSITSMSEFKAGENDTLPREGIMIVNKLLILPAAASVRTDSSFADGVRSIRLLVGRNGWGTGVHPTTRLCLEWLCQTIGSGDKHHHDHPVVLDYGCGSGILSIAALHLGAASVIGVDVEAEALVTAERNVQLNGYSTSTTTVGSTTTTTVTTKPHFRAYHVREMEPESGRGGLVDICVANILIGQLVRPSMVAVLVSYVKPGGLLCLSGVRPSEVPSLQQAYNAYMDWVDQAELSATETLGSVESYGFDVGRWSRVVGRRKVKMLDVEDMSELAIS